MIERELQAEYILKSLLNYSKAILQADSVTTSDMATDPFAMYTRGIPVPPALLGMTEENLGIDLEITPMNSRFNIQKSRIDANQLSDPINQSSNDSAYIANFYNLFTELGFGTDNESHPYGKYKGQSFGIEDMIANLIDFQDADASNFSTTFSRSYVQNGSINISGKLDNKDWKYPLSKISELQLIPGFTPNRIAKLAPFISFEGDTSVNINFLPDILYKSLDPNLLNDAVIKNIRNQIDTNGGFADLGTFNNFVPGFTNTGGIDFKSNRYRVIGKVSYGQTSFYMDAVVDKSQGLPAPEIYRITSLKFY